MSKKSQWLRTLGAMTDRLVVSTSYSAVRQGSLYIQSVSYSESAKSLFQLACAFLFLIFAIRSRTLQGLQNVLIMIAAQSFSAGMPLPQEPSGSLVLPAIAVYFALAALAMGCAIQMASDKAIMTRTMQYISLFVTARGLARVQAIKQQNVLGILSFVYLMLPLSLQPSEDSSLSFFIQNVDCLANRGLVIWLIEKIQVFTGVSSLFPNVLFFLALLTCNPMRNVPRMQNCIGVFTFYAAREIVQLMQQKMSAVVCCSLLMTLSVCMIANGDAVSPLFCVITMSTGVLFTTWLEQWIRNWSLGSDWMVIYLIVFVALESAGKYVKRNETKAEIIIEAIGHHETMLGLPHVADASGAH